MSLPVYDAPVGNALSWVAFSLNVILSLSQLPLMRAMIADVDPLSLAKYSMFPSLLQAITCGMWCGYGAFSLGPGTGTTLIANNAIGLTLSFVYVAVFVAKRPAVRDKALAAGLWLACVSAAVIVYASIYSRSADDFPGRDTLAGALTTVITIFFWASPLSALRAAAADLDDTRVPVPLSLAMLGTTTTWTIVGVLIGDMALVVCSAFGVALSLVQFGVLLWIKRSRNSRSSRKVVEGPEASEPASEAAAAAAAAAEQPAV
jgi:hypothetical protein